jgi:hypothetical protein
MNNEQKPEKVPEGDDDPLKRHEVMLENAGNLVWHWEGREDYSAPIWPPSSIGKESKVKLLSTSPS